MLSLYSSISVLYLEEYRVLLVAEFISEPNDATVFEFAEYWNKAGPKYNLTERNCQHMAKTFITQYCEVEHLKTQTDWANMVALNLGFAAIFMAFSGLNK